MSCCDPDPVRRRITVEGIVQGVGFRPFVHSLAERLSLSGYVINNSRGVIIEVEGDEDDVKEFERGLAALAPPLSHITKVNSRDAPILGTSGFSIRESEDEGVKTALVAPDSDVCGDCLRELFDPADRRYRYPFINCTNCGPRFTIITAIPYDRPNTTMRRFEMCGKCRAEYENPADRRFHAQPVACPVCGPRLFLRDEAFRLAAANDPLTETIALLKAGKIAAIKGIGGYHLAVNAEDEAAVARLRERKRRDEKPFAIMAPDLETLGKFADVGAVEASLLESRPHPITLVRKKNPDVLPGIAPSNSFLGAMLPYSPLHHLLLKEGGFAALVMTSANVSDDPIVHTEDDAEERLAGIADAFLVHDRPIHARADDSIERVMSHGPVILRRSRGYAPVPVQLDREYPPVLAAGGELKNTFCLIKGDRAFLSQHMGDLKYESVYNSFKAGIESFLKLMDVAEPAAIACDAHPLYWSSGYAEERAGEGRVVVQHHHAHFASLMAETQQDGEAIGVIFDGTGYGHGGQIWGGEFLAGGIESFERAATIKPVPLPGGDKAIKEPYRIALAVLFELYGADLPKLPAPWLEKTPKENLELIRKMVERGINTPLSHGMGRLFDAASALLGPRGVASFEGQAAMELEMAAAEGVEDFYGCSINDDSNPAILDFSPAFTGMVDDILGGRDTGVIAAKFHNTVAGASRAMVSRIKEKTGLDRVFLSGGVFQNAYLSDRLGAMLEADGFRVFRHSRVPPNDGGISLGQAVVAARSLE
ncbi:MAG: carbamoyltransferase HypF [Candidatus Nitrospinota bacterium M3_3B_026]